VAAGVAIGWSVEGNSAGSVNAAVRFSAVVWLLGHGLPAHVANGGTFSLAPLALSILILWRLVRAGSYTARGIGLGSSIMDAPTEGRAVVRMLAPVIGAVAGMYGLLGCLAATLASSPNLSVSPWRALLTTGLLAAAAAGVGALAESGLFGGMWRRVPRQSRHALRTAVVSVLLLFGVGSALAGVTVAVTGGAAVGLLRSYHTGIAGQVGLTVLCLVYAPTVALWALSYVVGPGFALGVGTEVSPLRVELGPLPALPVFSGLPDQPVSWLGGLVLAVPLLATALAGMMLARRSDLRTPRLAKAAALAGIPAGVMCAGLGVLASGALGAERLVKVGPVWWQLGVFGGLVVAVGAPLGAVGYRLVRNVGRR
jgi:hypothetical protein